MEVLLVLLQVAATPWYSLMYMMDRLKCTCCKSSSDAPAPGKKMKTAMTPGNTYKERGSSLEREHEPSALELEGLNTLSYRLLKPRS